MSVPSIGYTLQVNANNFVITNASGSTVFTSTNAATAWNQLQTLISGSGLAGNVVAGTYPTSAPIIMKSNAYLKTESGVIINHTGNSHIFDVLGISNSSINANGNLEIIGQGSSGFDQEIGFYFSGTNNQIIIQSTVYEGLKLHRLGGSATSMPNNTAYLNNSTFRNIYAYDWSRHGLYPWHGISLDGLYNVLFDNVHSNGMDNTNARSTLLIGGQNAPSTYVTINGGLYENAYADNGIYLGGWQQPVHHITLNNVTTSGNNKARTAHSGLKIRPASYVTVRNWHSIGDYQGCEIGTCYDASENSTYNTGGSWYNSIQGIIDNPTNVGFIIGTDGSDKGQSNQNNEFFLTINNAGLQSSWWYNGGVTAGVSNNMFRLVSNGANRQALSLEGEIINNTIYGIFANNGKTGYPDITLAGSGNTINVVSTTGNPNGLYTGSGGTVIYPYTGTVPPVPSINPTLTVHTTPEGVPFTIRRVA